MGVGVGVSEYRGRLVVLLSDLSRVLHQPRHSLLQAIAGLRAASLDLPLTVAALGELKDLSDNLGVLGRGKILLVGKDEHGQARDGLEYLLESGVGLLQATVIGCIYDKHKAVGGGVVVLPELTQGTLAAKITQLGVATVHLEVLDIESLGGALRGDGALGVLICLSEELEDRGLAGVVEAENEDSGVLVPLGTVADGAEHV